MPDAGVPAFPNARWTADGVPSAGPTFPGVLPRAWATAEGVPAAGPASGARVETRADDAAGRLELLGLDRAMIKATARTEATMRTRPPIQVRR